MKLKQLINQIKKLPDKALDAEVLYWSDETGQKVKSVDYDENLNIVFICDEIENK